MKKAKEEILKKRVVLHIVGTAPLISNRWTPIIDTTTGPCFKIVTINGVRHIVPNRR